MNQFSYMPGLLAFVFLVVFASCRNNDAESVNIKNINPERVYFDYKIWAEEGNDSLTILLQFRYNDENGPSLALEEPCKVEMDGEEIGKDSSKITGAFYELIRPMDKFTGPHHIIFTDINKKEYKESFSFQPISLKET